MGFRTSRRSNIQEAETAGQTARQHRSHGQQEFSTGAIWTTDTDRAEQHYGMTIPDDRTLQRLQIAEDTHGQQIHDWIDEGMPADILGKTRDMKAFRKRQAERPPEVPTNIERRNRRSVLRSEQAAADTGSAGETGVPEPVRDVIASTGRSLDGSVQRAMEDRMGDSLGDVRIHTGPQAAAACEAINARAFTVGNHVAFNQGEYDPGSPEGQHVLAHELAHVRQQTGGAVSMLPQQDVELQVDPYPALEREAEETAQQVMEDGPVVVNRMGCEMHIQRMANWGEHPQTTAKESETEASDSDVNFAHVLRVLGKTGVASAVGGSIAKGSAVLAGLSDPAAAQALLAFAASGTTITAGWVALYREIDPQLVRSTFEAADRGHLLDAILKRLGDDVETDKETVAGQSRGDK